MNVTNIVNVITNIIYNKTKYNNNAGNKQNIHKEKA